MGKRYDAWLLTVPGTGGKALATAPFLYKHQFMWQDRAAASSHQKGIRYEFTWQMMISCYAKMNQNCPELTLDWNTGDGALYYPQFARAG